MNASPTSGARFTLLLSVQQLVGQLHDLRAGPGLLPRIIALGRPAIAPPEAFLRGPSRSLPQQRVLAADALAVIGEPEAVAALIRALRDSCSRELAPMALTRIPATRPPIWRNIRPTRPLRGSRPPRGTGIIWRRSWER